MEGVHSSSELTSWLQSGRTLFLIIHFLGITCFAYIVAKRLVPLRHAARDLRFDRPLARLLTVLKYWFGQWKHPRYRTAGIIHICIFGGFILLVLRAFTVLLVGVTEDFVMPGLSGSAGHTYNLITDYAATLVFLCMIIAIVRRLVFKPARYEVPARFGKSHKADAIFLLSLIAVLMAADSLFAAAEVAAESLQGQSTELLAAGSLPWLMKVALDSRSLSVIGGLYFSAYLVHELTFYFLTPQV